MLRLDDGETLTARTVVMATGISNFGYVPEPLASLPAELCTHSGEPRNLSNFRGKRVVVVGGGASATDLAALLHEEGASVGLVTRHPLKFHLPPSGRPRSMFKRITAPNLGLGPGFRSAVYTALPGLFRWLPRDLRLRIVRRHLGPSGGWFMKEKVMGKVDLHVGYTVQTTTPRNGSVAIRLVHSNGSSLDLEADHVIAATGYVADVERLTILERRLRSGLRIDEQSPALSSVFESSYPGLYFIGVASANSFGPVMRFAVGAEYAARRLGNHFERIYGQLTEPTARQAMA
jgi:thioredoxin reductase